MAIISGARGTGNITAALRKPDYGDKILLLEPNAAPITVISKRAGKMVTGNPEFKWFEDTLDTRFVAASGTHTTTITTINVAAGFGQYFAQHDLVKNTRTGEVFRVTAVATDALTVVRGVGASGTGVAMNDADELLILGSAQPEGDTSKPARTNTVSSVTGYTQIFRRPIETTGTLRASETYAQNDWDYQIGKYGIEHLKDIEEAFLFGKASEDTSGSQPRRTTAGVLSRISTNVTAAGGVLSETSFWGALRGAFDFNTGGTLFAFGSLLALDVLNGYARSKVQVNDTGGGTYGVNMTTYQSPHGTLKLAGHRLLRGTTYGGYLVLLDMSSIKYRYLKGRDTHVRENIQQPDADTRKDEWFTECGLQVGEESKHALISGITG